MSPKATADLEAEAAEILRSVDDRAAALNQTALNAAREGEQARQNARKAADLARRNETRRFQTSTAWTSNGLQHRGVWRTRLFRW